MRQVSGLVLHIAEGYFEGTISWGKNPESGYSSHFVVGKGGAVAQLVETGQQAWCQRDGNSSWLSVENAGWAGESLTPEQVLACARILARAHTVYGVPLAMADSPDGRGLGWHGMGGAAWGGHFSCPGAPVLAQRTAIVARAKAECGESRGEDRHVVSLIKLKGRPEVFVTDGVTARHVAPEQEMDDLRQLDKDGVITLGYGGQIRVVTRRTLIGRIVGTVPAGWEDLAA